VLVVDVMKRAEVDAEVEVEVVEAWDEKGRLHEEDAEKAPTNLVEGKLAAATKERYTDTRSRQRFCPKEGRLQLCIIESTEWSN
jgi:hypothetical protein